VLQTKRCLAGLMLVAGLLIALQTGHGQPVPAPEPQSAAPTLGRPIIATSRAVTPSQAAPAPTANPPTLTLPAPPPVSQMQCAMPDDGLLPPICVKTPQVGTQQTAYKTDAPAKLRDEVTDAALRPAVVPARLSSLSVEVQGPARVAAGDPVPFEILVHNNGSMILTAVRLEQQLPAGAILRSAEPMPQPQGDLLVWNLGYLEGNGQRRLRVEIQPGKSGELTINPTAAFTALAGLRTQVAQMPVAPAPIPRMPVAAPPEIQTVAAVMPQPTPSALVVTQVSPDTVQRGSTVAMQIQIANRGSSPLTNVIVRDLLPPGLEHPQGSAIEAPLGALAPGEEKSLPLEVVASQAGPLVNDVLVIADGGVQAQSRRTIQVNEAALGIKIEVPNPIALGRDTDVRLELSNPSPKPLANVRFLQMVPDGFDVVSISGGGTFDALTHSISWSVGTLPAGQRLEFALRLRPKLAGDWRLHAEATAAELPQAAVQEMGVHVQ
jgi:uncharacterized repeat protein (TIGR01451 family)